jgi:hypothetical protein
MDLDDLTRAFAGTRETLKMELEKARHSSLIAARKGDYRRVAELTRKAVRLYQELLERSSPGNRITPSLPAEQKQKMDSDDQIRFSN